MERKQRKWALVVLGVCLTAVGLFACKSGGNKSTENSSEISANNDNSGEEDDWKDENVDDNGWT